MNYVKKFNINGVDTKQIACIELQGVPNAATEGAVGVLGMDITSPTHEIYRCVAVNGGIYTWELLSAGMSIISATITGEGGETKDFPYTSLRIPNNYIIKRGDLILDSEGYLYQIDALGSDSCVGTYCCTHIGGIASGDKDYSLVFKNGKLQLVTESGNVVSNLDYISADEDTIHRDTSTGIASVRGIRTINETSLRLFVGTKAEYDVLTDEQKTDLFAIISDDGEQEKLHEALNILQKILNGTQVVGRAKNDTNGLSLTERYLHEVGAGVPSFEGDPKSGVMFYSRNKANSGQLWLPIWKASGTRNICFGLVWFDGETTTITPNVYVGGKNFVVSISSTGSMGEWAVGEAKVMEVATNGALSELTINNTTLEMRALTTGYYGE